MTGSDVTEHDLALAVAAEAPRPRAAFEAELGRRMAEGFPRERRIPRIALPRRKVLLPAMAGVASVLVAVTLVLSNGGSEEPSVQLSPGSSLAERSTPNAAAPAPRAAGDDTFSAKSSARRIERSARLTLAAPADRLRRVGDRVTAITDRYRGFVLRSSIASGEDATGGGSYELRVPARELREALRDLSALGTVRSLSQDGQDVTSGYASVADQLRTARAERTGLLRRLERADSATAAGALRRQLELNAGRVASLRTQQRDLRERTDYAAVSVTLERRGDTDAVAPGPRSGIDDAFHDAVGTLGSTAEFAVRALGVAIPAGALALMAWLAGRVIRRRRRDTILG